MKKCNCECCRKNRQSRSRRFNPNSDCNQPTNAQQLINRTERTISEIECQNRNTIQQLSNANNNFNCVNFSQPIAALTSSQNDLNEITEDLNSISNTLKCISSYIDDMNMPNLNNTISQLNNSASNFDSGVEDVNNAISSARFIDNRLIPKLRNNFADTVNYLQNGNDDDDDFCGGGNF